MKEKKLIPSNLLSNFPFMYQYFQTTKADSKQVIKMMPHIAGKIPSIQNEHSKLTTFYKCISRF